jgi:hypothetical protein
MDFWRRKGEKAGSREQGIEKPDLPVVVHAFILRWGMVIICNLRCREWFVIYTSQIEIWDPLWK